MRKEFSNLLSTKVLFKNDSYRLYRDMKNELILLTAYGERINLGKILSSYDNSKSKPVFYTVTLRKEPVPSLILYQTEKFDVCLKGEHFEHYYITKINEKMSNEKTAVYTLFKDLGKDNR